MKTMRWLLLGVSLLALVPLAADPGNVLQPRSSVTVYDSKGKTVGTMIDATATFGDRGRVPIVAFKAGQQSVFVAVLPDHFVGNADILLFSTSDCSGTPYFQSPPPNGPSLVSSSFVKNDGTLYAAPGNSTASTTVYIVSAFGSQANFPGPDLCGSFEIGDTQVVEAELTGNFTGMFQPPFVLK
jgi:hypothetical protein